LDNRYAQLDTLVLMVNRLVALVGLVLFQIKIELLFVYHVFLDIFKTLLLKKYARVVLVGFSLELLDLLSAPSVLLVPTRIIPTLSLLVWSAILVLILLMVLLVLNVDLELLLLLQEQLVAINVQLALMIKITFNVFYAIQVLSQHQVQVYAHHVKRELLLSSQDQQNALHVPLDSTPMILSQINALDVLKEPLLVHQEVLHVNHAELEHSLA